MKSPKRKVLIAAALVATLVAAYFAPARPDEVAMPPPRANATSPTNSGETARVSAAIDGQEAAPFLRPRTDEENAGLLGAFTIPTAPSAVAQAPVQATPVNAIPSAVAPPVPPPLPFQVVGKFVDGSDQRVFLIFNGRNLVVHPGDAIGSDYTVSAISADQMTVQYVPLDVSQTVALPAPH